MLYQKSFTINELIELVKTKSDRDCSYCVFNKVGEDNNLNLDTIVFIDEYAEIDDDDNEEYSQFVYDNDLELYCREELIQDAVDNAIHQKPGVSNKEILANKRVNLHDINFFF